MRVNVMYSGWDHGTEKGQFFIPHFIKYGINTMILPYFIKNTQNNNSDLITENSFLFLFLCLL